MIKLLLKITLPFAGILFFSSFGATTHMLMSSPHALHDLVERPSCASLCSNLPTHKGINDEDTPEDDEADSHHAPTFMSLLESVSENAVHESQALIASRLDPPPGQPSYIQNAVFRV